MSDKHKGIIARPTLPANTERPAYQPPRIESYSNEEILATLGPARSAAGSDMLMPVQIAMPSS